MQNQKPIDRRQRRTKIAFQNALKSLLEEKDLEDISVKELAERADRDRKTFYLHYDSINDLLDEIIKEKIQETIVEIGRSTITKNGEIDIKTLYKSLGESFFIRFDAHTPIIDHISNVHIINRMYPILVSVIKESGALGLADALGDHLDLFISYFCAGILFLYNEWFTSKSQLPLETLAELSAAMTAGGITSLTKVAKNMNIQQY